ncbi:hypothetical protein SEA_HONK_26 [Microbacterium phage Honk]|uniref:Uncharacterized protein n=1 Tax=Microbacterium phage Honk TaxID=2836095 RepID=A0A8F3INW5_9CAUD|nr:hypothetical protein SEA_HONK_26 [Microbacterium phage Honk]
MTPRYIGPRPVEHLKAARRGALAYREAVANAANSSLIEQADAELAELDAAIALLESAL